MSNIGKANESVNPCFNQNINDFVKNNIAAISQTDLDFARRNMVDRPQTDLDLAMEKCTYYVSCL